MKSTNHPFHQGEGGGDTGGDGEARAGACFDSESCIDSDMVPEDHCNREEVKRESVIEKWRTVSTQQNQGCVHPKEVFSSLLFKNGRS